MKILISVGLKFENNQLEVLNQQALPQREEWLISRNIADMIDIIKTLKVRGAPLIGIAAALSLAQYVLQGATENEILLAAEKLKTARPTAVNLSYCIDRLLKIYTNTKGKMALVQEAEIIF